MRLSIFSDYEQLSTAAALEIMGVIQNNPRAVLCLATGDTPKRCYDLLVEKCLAAAIDLSGCTFIGLDEWVGIPPATEGSCHYFLQNRLFAPLNIQPRQIHLFDGMADDLAGVCRNMDAFVESTGGIDFMLVGVGLNGHIGFNEPGAPVDGGAQLVQLEAITQKVGQKYFDQAATIPRGVTLGMRQVLASKKLLLLANGSKKSAIMREVFTGAIGSEVPASLLRNRADAMAFIDKAAASGLPLESLPADISLGKQ